MSKYVAVEKSQNTVGTEFALMREPSGSFGVWVKCANYAGHVRGGIAYTWRVCSQKQTEADAREVYARKLKGKAK